MRRALSKGHKKTFNLPHRYYVLSLGLVAAVVWYLTFVNSFLTRSSGTTEETKVQTVYGCVAWRQTRSCSPYGVRDEGGDQPCDIWISRSSGYCECDNFLTVKRLECGTYTAFRCMDACAKLSDDLQAAEVLPANVTCNDDRSHDASFFGAAASWLQAHRKAGTRHHLNNQQLMALRDMEQQAAKLWWGIRAAVEIVEEEGISIPEPRTHAMDWVRDGVHMPSGIVKAAKDQWRRFMSEAPSYPAPMFKDKGIVILAGGLTYMVPAWINIHMLRRTGCQLPVEMFFPKKEYPTLAMEHALNDLGVTCRKLPDLRPEKEKPKSDEQPIADTEPSLSGFTMKIAALILSQFKEVVFLDSDNVAVQDPALLFQSEAYKETGALLWPDYWQSSAAPDLAKILDVEGLPKETFESGQMVYDKERVWSGLLLAAFFNMQSDFYYELFSNFMGKGDKESFAHSLRAAHIPYSSVRHPVGSIGETVRQCNFNGACRKVFLGNSMTQYSPEGEIMFLHTNLSPKWNLEIPGNFSHYRRRWKQIVPGNEDFIERFGDLELEVYETLILLRCSPFLPSYVEVLASEERMGKGKTLPIGLRGFHPMNPGVEFRQAYRWGLSGPYLRFTKVTFRDRLINFLNNSVKPGIFYLGRVFYRPVGLFTGKPAFFSLW